MLVTPRESDPRLCGVWILLRPLVTVLPWVSMQYTLGLFFPDWLTKHRLQFPPSTAQQTLSHTHQDMNTHAHTQIKGMKSLLGFALCSASFDLHTLLQPLPIPFREHAYFLTSQYLQTAILSWMSHLFYHLTSELSLRHVHTFQWFHQKKTKVSNIDPQNQIPLIPKTE